MRVRAKFYVAGVFRTAEGPTKVNLLPVVSGSDENRSFWEATPSGSIELYISAGRPAADVFHAGEEYYVDFIPAEEGQVEQED